MGTTAAETVKTPAYVGNTVAVTHFYLGDYQTIYTAVYFDIESAEFKEHSLGWTPEGAKVDAPQRVREAYAMEQEARKAIARAASERHAIRQEAREAEWEAQKPSKGKVVKVVKGRKVPKGTVATVKVNCDGQWGRSVLLTLEDGTEVWTSESNVEVITDLAVAA